LFTYDAIQSACQALDSLGLPRAIGRFDADRLIFANDSFVRATGLERDELKCLALSEIVKIRLKPSEEMAPGKLVPMVVRSRGEREILGGHAIFGDSKLVYLMLPAPSESNVEYEAAVAVGREQERRRIGTYVHENLAQEVVSMVFSIESMRLDLENKDPAAAAKLKQIGERLTKLFDGFWWDKLNRG
jgi:signal transduction histidine kinase